jgi:hypothetical protein
MAGILLSKRRIHAHLKKLGFKPTKNVTQGHVGHRFWVTPWGHFFPVPDEDFVCATWDLLAILADVERTRPA